MNKEKLKLYNNIRSIFVIVLLISTALPVVTSTYNEISLYSTIFNKMEIINEIKKTDDKVLVIDEIIGERHVKYWEHIIDDIYVKNDLIIINMDVQY